MPGRSIPPDEKKRFIETIQAAQSQGEFHDIFLSLMQSFGFELFAVFTMPSEQQGSMAACTLLTNGSDAFYNRCDELGYLTKSRVFLKLRHIYNPVQWHVDDLIEDLPPADRTAYRDFLAAAGIRFVFYYPTPSTSGPRRVVSFAGQGELLTQTQTEALSYYVIQLMGSFNALETGGDGLVAVLSSIERDCLQKSAQGLEAVAISGELGLSSKTVQYLLASICRKLDVQSIDQAVAKAIGLGIIS